MICSLGVQMRYFFIETFWHEDWPMSFVTEQWKEEEFSYGKENVETWRQNLSHR